ncbi:hypothetical protein SCLCIDRAFT_18443 [Scleroderma citrinum Foug A]|uniref:GPN-loop GTPase 2 n=1 Tax=Scleroderma citrinum Foug A TaxID=1036808 RepID=A0A0C2ZE41_9AGAM|nr:hypothetical protein SCLCIDRAFT_18443 [Scleroderma citrinum Foug A]
MPFGEIVCGAPGNGKSTYCYGKHQLFTALQRPISIVNLDPANENIVPVCNRHLVSHHSSGCDGCARSWSERGTFMLYCMEYLEANFDWLESRLHELRKDAHLAAVHLCDAHYVTDAVKYVSVLLLSLRTILQLELPHINVLSKVDLLSQYGDLDFNLDFYTEVQDLSYLENVLNTVSPRFTALNMAFISVIEDFGLVGSETLAVEDKASILHLSRVIGRATGYIFVPPKDAPIPEGIKTGSIRERK